MAKRGNLKTSSGTTRDNRFLEALDPATAPIDERSCQDLLAFALDFSKLLNYYDSGNQPVSDWSPFFERDLCFLLAQIVTTDVLRDHFQGWALQNAVKAGRGNTKEILKAIYRIVQRIDHWYIWAADIAKKDRADNQLRKTLESIIESDVGHYLGNHIQDILKTLQPSPDGESWTDYWSRQEARLQGPWRAEEKADQPVVLPPYYKPVDGLLAILRALHLATQKLQRVARQYLEESLSRSDHPPHTALYIAFAKLLLLLKDKINQLSERHLIFYYHDVLRLSERPSSPDVVHVTFELAPELKSFMLPAGTRLLAGKDKSGKPIEYATDQDTFLNQARISSMRALYLARTHSALAPEEGQRVTGIFALPQVNSQDGMGAALVAPESGWPTFGINEATNDGLDTAPLQADLGFIVSSPVLLLQEGERHVIVTIAIAGDGKLETALQRYKSAADEILDSPEPIEVLLADAFLVFVSGEKGWLPVTNASFRRHPVVGTTMEIEFTLNAIDPAVVPNRVIAPEADAETQWPLFKLTLNPQARVYAYTFFNNLEIETIEFRVNVRGVQKLQLRNDLGPLDPAQPFPVFGPVPTQGSYLLLNHRELNVKSVDHVTLCLTWFNLPKAPEDMESYYAGYDREIRNDSFKTRLSLLGANKWMPPADGHELFPLFARDYDQSGGLLPVTVIGTEIPEIPMPVLPSPTPAVLSEAEAPRGCIRLELAEPAFAFGHQEYPGIMARAAIANAGAAKKGASPALPNPPLAPVAKNVVLDYDASDKLLLTHPLPENRHAHFYSLHPFGYLPHQGRATNLFADYGEQGHLYLGISQAGPRESLSLLFGICDTAFSPVPRLRQRQDGASPIRWRYLSGDEWKDLPAWMLLSDSTMGLTRSGMVKLALPGDITNQSTLMPAGVCWIEAAAPRVAGVYWSRVVSLATQAASGKRQCDPQSALDPAQVPAGSVTQLSPKLLQVKAVRQPFASAGGRSRESAAEFRIRVSERLRHKDRAILSSDFEQIVLDAFPEVGQVKCIGYKNSRDFPGTTPISPGTLYLVVTPRLENNTERQPRLPQNLLKTIENYIQRHASAFLAREIHVINPVYETLKIFATVEFKLEGDGSGYSDDLEAALSQYLQQWRGEAMKPMPIGRGQVQGYEIASLIQQQSYVSRLHYLRMLHTFQTESGYESRWLSKEDRAWASAPWAVLIPASHHSITSVDPEQQSLIDPGIRNLTIGTDFVMSSEKEKKEDGPDLRYFLVVPAHHEHGSQRR